MKKALIATVVTLLILVVVLAGVYVFLAAPGSKASDQLQPLTEQPIAHRGYYDNEAGIPENSFPAFERAIANGYAIELDVQITADGTPVVFHDQDTERMCGKPGKVYELTNAELKQLRLLETDEWIPTLAQTLELIGGRVPLLVEIKGLEGDSPQLIARAAALLLDSYEGDFAVQSFNPFALQWFKDNRPDIARGQLLQDFIKDDEELSYINRIALTTMMTNVLSRPNFISYELEDADQVNLKLMRELTKIDCFAWTLRSQDELEAARDAGFIGFIFEGFDPRL